MSTGYKTSTAKSQLLHNLARLPLEWKNYRCYATTTYELTINNMTKSPSYVELIKEFFTSVKLNNSCHDTGLLYIDYV